MQATPVRVNSAQYRWHGPGESFELEKHRPHVHGFFSNSRRERESPLQIDRHFFELCKAL